MVALQAEHANIRYVDIAVYSRDDELQLVSEVKNKTGAGASWAAEMRRNIIAHLTLPRSPFFLLALPDHFYLWGPAAAPVGAVPPEYDIDPTPLLTSYVGDSQHALNGLTEAGLTLAVSSWLTDLVAANSDATLLGPEREWLVDSGLYQAIKGGFVKAPIAP